MIIFKYINKKDNSLIGYHLSSFCQVGSKEGAKRYSCTKETVDEQLKIIQKNFNTVINSTKENQKDKIIDLSIINEAYFKGLSQNDVEIQYEEVPDTEIIYKTTIIS